MSPSTAGPARRSRRAPPTWGWTRPRCSSNTWINAFPGGERELIEYFSAWADRRTLAALEALDPGAMKIRDRIAAGVRLRLELLAPHHEAAGRALSFLALPQNALLGLTCLYRSVDSLWYAAGDRATDHNYYSKRLLLAGVLSSTYVCWLNDHSEGSRVTWDFLDRRIDEVLKAGGRFAMAMQSCLDLPDRLLQRRTRAGLWRR